MKTCQLSALTLGLTLLCTGCQLNAMPPKEATAANLAYHFKVVTGAFEHMLPIVHQYYPINSTIYQVITPPQASDTTQATYKSLSTILRSQGAALCSSEHICPVESIPLKVERIPYKPDNTFLIKINTSQLNVSALFYDNGKLISNISVLTDLPKLYQLPLATTDTNSNFQTSNAFSSPTHSANSHVLPKASSSKSSSSALTTSKHHLAPKNSSVRTKATATPHQSSTLNTNSSTALNDLGSQSSNASTAQAPTALSQSSTLNAHNSTALNDLEAQSSSATTAQAPTALSQSSTLNAHNSTALNDLGAQSSSVTTAQAPTALPQSSTLNAHNSAALNDLEAQSSSATTAQAPTALSQSSTLNAHNSAALNDLGTQSSSATTAQAPTALSQSSTLNAHNSTALNDLEAQSSSVTTAQAPTALPQSSTLNAHNSAALNDLGTQSSSATTAQVPTALPQSSTLNAHNSTALNDLEAQSSSATTKANKPHLLLSSQGSVSAVDSAILDKGSILENLAKDQAPTKKLDSNTKVTTWQENRALEYLQQACAMLRTQENDGAPALDRNDQLKNSAANAQVPAAKRTEPKEEPMALIEESDALDNSLASKSENNSKESLGQLLQRLGFTI